MDMITADGIWDWTVIDWVDPAGLGGSSDWYCDQYNKPPPEKLPIIKRAAVNFLSGRDELQEVVRASYPVVGSPYYGRLYWWDKWFDENCNRVESPLGDNEDAFNNGYNELFTTYSNPPSYNKDRLPTDTGIKFFQPSGSNVFHFEFYNSDTAIIDAPPSKPQNLKIAKSPNNHPYLTWAANLERDVLSYKIQKRLDLYLPWQDLATTTQNSYEDLTEEYLPYGPTINIAYRIIAKDNQMLESCPSDLCETRVYGNPQKDNNSKEVFTIDCYRLDQNYPNPFNPTTVIHYDVKNSGRVQLKIFDILGKEVAFLVDQHKETGSYSVNFDATNLPSGVYIYSISINDFVQSKKMSLVR